MNTMIGKLALLAVLAVLLTAVQGDPVVKNSRNGNLNTYYFYTKLYDNGRTPLTLTDDHLDSETTIPNLVSTDVTVVIVHGHGGDATTTLNPLVKDSFFDGVDDNVNVFVVDWSDYTKQSYSTASAAVQSVGTALGQLLKTLDDQDKIDITNSHLIGFNLGAHVVGYAGRTLNGEVARITGLDPSGSGWGSSSPRLSKDDARYVEVIHTDGSGILANGIGTSLGDVDFFVNGGSNQPGCITHDCAHRRAYELFAATLTRDEPLLGNLCTTNLQVTLNTCRGQQLAVGGAELFKRHNGNVYRVNTGRSSPF